MPLEAAVRDQRHSEDKPNKRKMVGAYSMLADARPPDTLCDIIIPFAWMSSTAACPLFSEKYRQGFTMTVQSLAVIEVVRTAGGSSGRNYLPFSIEATDMQDPPS
ncbi:hypothetical protein VE03_07471 [Pseudogymnoascus sp. 23342-1-I1]|nr:hypothetical protein VE03_07471 [Pseudogymnoascus sp. 23342-1-I1]